LKKNNITTSKTSLIGAIIGSTIGITVILGSFFLYKRKKHTKKQDEKPSTSQDIKDDEILHISPEEDNNNDNITNEWINWIEEAIDKEHLKYYEYNQFNNIQEIGIGSFGKVYRARWKLFEHLALKSFFNLNITTAKEIVHEV
jgi:hypothetical protein